MGALVFLLAAVLLAAGAVSGYLGLDLLPTGPGLLYVFSGVVAAVGAVVAIALGVVAMRLGRLTAAVREQAEAASALAAGLARVDSSAATREPPEVAEAVDAAPDALDEETDYEDEASPNGDAAGAAPDAPRSPADVVADEATNEGAVNENRAGHLPTLAEIERAIETPEPPPTLIGRYSSGGASYMIFSDGSIEAETDEGAFKFASMGDFKQFLLDRGDRGGGAG